MRLLALAAAAALAAVTAVPANAAYYPVCGVQLAAAAAGTEKSCRSGNVPTSPNTRTLTVQGVTGTVTASLTCFNYPLPNTEASITVTGTERRAVSVREYDSCVATLVAVTDGATASGTSTFTPIFYPEP